MARYVAHAPVKNWKIEYVTLLNMPEMANAIALHALLRNSDLSGIKPFLDPEFYLLCGEATSVNRNRFKDRIEKFQSQLNDKPSSKD